jgi:hypothetical protein
MEIGMGEDRIRSPEQWAPWIDAPDPPEPPMMPEQLQKMSDGVRELLAQPARNSSGPLPMKTLDQIYEEIIAAFLRAHPTLTREQVEKEFESFF